MAEFIPLAVMLARTIGTLLQAITFDDMIMTKLKLKLLCLQSEFNDSADVEIADDICEEISDVMDAVRPFIQNYNRDFIDRMFDLNSRVEFIEKLFLMIDGVAIKLRFSTVLQISNLTQHDISEALNRLEDESVIRHNELLKAFEKLDVSIADINNTVKDEGRKTRNHIDTNTEIVIKKLDNINISSNNNSMYVKSKANMIHTANCGYVKNASTVEISLTDILANTKRYKKCGRCTATLF